MRGECVRQDRSHDGSSYEQIQQFYNEVKNYSAFGVFSKKTINIHSISEQHIIAERICGQYKVIVIINRSSKKARIPIPQEYAEAQVIFCKGGVNNNYFEPNAALVLKI